MGWMLFEKRFTASATSSRDTAAAVLFLSSCLLSIDVCKFCTRLVHFLHLTRAIFALASAFFALADASTRAFFALVRAIFARVGSAFAASPASVRSTSRNHTALVRFPFSVSMNPCSSSERFRLMIVWLLAMPSSFLSWSMETGNFTGQPSLFAMRNSRRYMACSFASRTPALCSPKALSWSINFTGAPSHFLSP